MKDYEIPNMVKRVKYQSLNLLLKSEVLFYCLKFFHLFSCLPKRKEKKAK